MSNWDAIRNIIIEKDQGKESDAWAAQRKGLLEIFEKCDAYEIEPPLPENFQLSQYREIIKEAKEAIKELDQERLKKLIDMANTLTVEDLRIRLEKKYRPSIYYKQEGGFYVIELTPKQFKRVVKSTKSYFVYEDYQKFKEKFQ